MGVDEGRERRGGGRLKTGKTNGKKWEEVAIAPLSAWGNLPGSMTLSMDVVNLGSNGVVELFSEIRKQPAL